MATDAEEIREALAKPASATVTPTSTSATARSIQDEIAARKFAKSEEAAAGIEQGLWPLGGPFVINPPGAF